MNVSHTTILFNDTILPKGELKKTYYPVYVMKIKRKANGEPKRFHITGY